VKGIRTTGLVLVLLVLAVSAAEAANYAVVFSGGGEARQNYERYYEETLRIWGIMTGDLGYDVDQVYVLFSDGTDTGRDQNTGNYASPVYVNSDWTTITAAGGIIRDAEPATLQDTLLEIDELFVDGEDCFHFWSFDHGSNTDPATVDGGLLIGWGGAIRDDQFADWVSPIDGYAESYAMGQCFAGAMMDELQVLPDQSNRFYAWAAEWDELSWGRGWVDVWADALEQGLRDTHDIGNYANLMDPWGQSGTGDETPGWAGDNFHIITNVPYDVPEPGTVTLLGAGLGLFGVVLVRRRRRLAA